ncbi:MAG: class D sortase [Clostridia bacterium]|nr:class D sortase [Clostridia bacterium]
MLNKEKNKKTSFIGATIRSLIVAFIYVFIFVGIVYFLFSSKISMAMSIIDTISVDTSNKILEDVKIDLETRNLRSYPEYGTKYGNISLPSLGLSFDLYFGDSLPILKNGIGHSSGSYFPGEGGSIICMGHNYNGILKTLPNIKLGDEIIITTSYGIFTYKVNNTKIVYYTNTEELPIQKEEEILMLYTCYPTDGLGHAVDRYVVYASLESEQIIE